jgi:hypothetical protein
MALKIIITGTPFHRRIQGTCQRVVSVVRRGGGVAAPSMRTFHHMGALFSMASGGPVSAKMVSLDVAIPRRHSELSSDTS